MDSRKSDLKIVKTEDESFDIGILGSGVVGSATGLGFSGINQKVIFFDKSSEAINGLKSKNQSAFLNEDYQNQQMKFLFVCINTPSTADGINLEYIKNSMEMVGQIIRAQKNPIIVIVRSTIIPGTTENILLPLIEKSAGKNHGDHWHLAYQPEFLRAHSHEDDFLFPWMTIVGVKDLNDSVSNRLKQLYAPLQTDIHLLSIKEAEFAKYVNNLKLSTLISFSNEMWLLGKQFGIDANPIQGIVSSSYEPSWNPLYGSTGGFPFGGTCFPKDTKAMLKHAETLGIQLPLLDGVVKVNQQLEKLAMQGQAHSAVIKGINWKASPRKPNKKSA